MVIELAAAIYSYENTMGEKPLLCMNEKTLRDINRELAYPECIFSHVYNKKDAYIIGRIDGCHVRIDNMLAYRDVLFKKDGEKLDV